MAVTFTTALTAALGLPASAAPQVQTLDRSTDVPTLAAAERTLSARLGGAFGNAWLDSATGKFTVGVTDRSQIHKIRAAGGVPKVVKHSAAKLDSIVSRLNLQENSRPKSVTGWHADLPNLITNVATTDATVPDAAMTQPIHEQLQAKDLLPARHLLDSGYPSATLLAGIRRDFGVQLVTPLLADQSTQAKAGTGYDRNRVRH